MDLRHLGAFARTHHGLVTFEVALVECDGWRYRGADRDQWEFDLDRDAALSAAGYVVLRRSRGQIVREPRGTATRIRDLLRRWAPHLLTTSADRFRRTR